MRTMKRLTGQGQRRGEGEDCHWNIIVEACIGQREELFFISQPIPWALEVEFVNLLK